MNQLFKKILTWFDRYGLLSLSGFLIAFIPLYPKLPLFEAIPGYIVRVRLEDILIATTGIIWIIQLIRKKISWPPYLTQFIVAYAVVGLLSILSAIFLTNTVPNELIHIGKTTLHYFRYLEYFSLFFIVFSAVKSRKDINVLISILALTVLGITVYGLGQKYLYWPVYSTMNREFSKGVRLYLTEHARVQSTFGGHYDLGAYLVVFLPFLLALAYTFKNRAVKSVLWLSFWSGVLMLVFSASRTSFIGFILGVIVVILLMAIQKSSLIKAARWAFIQLSIVGFFTFIILSAVGDDMIERLEQVIKAYPVIYQPYSQTVKFTQLATNVYVPAALGMKEWPKAAPPSNGISTEEANNLLVKSDERPVSVRPDQSTDAQDDKPVDVYVDVPEYVVVATTSATGEVTYVTEERERVFSDCALTKSLSLCIRLETLWPLAIQGFKRNPLLGSGYATLNKATIQQFTEAESTDNNFLRTLGETGLLGFLTFYGTVAAGLWLGVKMIMKRDVFSKGIAIGFIGATIGLLLNAIYIDVFAASKVALSYWALTGILISLYVIDQSEQNQSAILTQRNKKKKSQMLVDHSPHTTPKSKTGKKKLRKRNND